MIIERVKSYDEECLAKIIRADMKKLKINIDAETAVIKPNIGGPAKPNSGIVTHPKFTGAIIDALRASGIEEITIAEGTSGGTDPDECFAVSGYKELAKRKNVRLLDLYKTQYKVIPWRYGTIKLPKTILDADLYVDVPKLKTHTQATVTLGLKNQKGLLPVEYKKEFHRLGLHEPIAELAKLISPNLTILDGIVGLEGDGPSFLGKKKRGNVLIMSQNVVEADATACRVIGIDPKQVEHIRYAADLKVGSLEPRILGEVTIEEANAPFEKPNMKCFKFGGLYVWRNPYACSMCVDSFTLAVKSAIRDVRQWPVLLRFLYHISLGRIDIIRGRHMKVPEGHGKIVCLGDCTQDVAKSARASTWIPGCPPKDVLEKMF